jgi:NitT/TauT family transport system substrate-binding protein
MKSKILKLVTLGTVLFLCLALVAGCGVSTQSTQSSELMPKLVLVGPSSPMILPLAYLVENDKLSDIAEETELVIWENPDQLKAIVSGGEKAHFLAIPSNSAATFYNKGMNLKMLDISMWGVLYIVSTDPEMNRIEDLEGKEVVVPFKGNMPDLLFKYVCGKKGIDIAEDMTIYEANSPQQTAQLLLSGQKECAVLTEPLVTQVLMKAKKQGISLYRSVDMQVEWGAASGLGDRIPIAGTVALPAIQDNDAAIQRFLEEYSLAIRWVEENPDEAGVLGAGIEQAGFEAKPVAEAVKHIKWDFIQVDDCLADLEAFYSATAEFEPSFIGGKLPDENLYHERFDLK